MTIPGQIGYDLRHPDDEPDAVFLCHVETAMEYLEKAAKALRADPCRMPEGVGFVEDAFDELRKILRNIN